jgi:hypothetical protein
MKAFRHNTPWLEQRLTRKQAAQLKQWLIREDISYLAAIARLQQRFGIHASTQQVAKFFQRHAAPKPRTLRRRGRPVELDLIIKAKGNRLQFTVHQRNPRVRVAVNGRPLRTGVAGSAKNTFSNFSPGLAAVDSARRRRQEEHQTGREAFSSP